MYAVTLLSATASESRSSGKERDSETGLDYFGARYYGSTMGRWLSPDWSESPTPVPFAVFSDPQSLNLYGYVRNNPLNTADLDGHKVDTDRTQRDNLLGNVRADEKKLFKWDKKTGHLTLDPKKMAKFEGEHSKGFNRLAAAISDQQHTVTVVTRTVSAYSGSNISTQDGGGTTNRLADGNSVVEISPNGNLNNRFNPGTVEGQNGDRVPDPINIIVGHEVLGHALAHMNGTSNTERDAIEVENELRAEQKLELRKVPN